MSSVPSPTPPTLPQDTPAGFWSMPSTEMSARLRALLPDGTHLSRVRLSPEDRAPGEPAVSKGWLQATVTRSGVVGESTIAIMLWAPERAGEVSGDPTSNDLVSYPGNLVAPTSCTEMEGRQSGVGRRVEIVDGTLVQREVTVTTGTGYVYVAIANTTDDKWGPSSVTSGAAPALTMDEVLNVATAPTWTDWSPDVVQ